MPTTKPPPAYCNNFEPCMGIRCIEFNLGRKLCKEKDLNGGGDLWHTTMVLKCHNCMRLH